MESYVIVNTVHTAIDSFNGSLASTSTIDLKVAITKAAAERTRINSLHIDEVIVGNVPRAGLGQSPAHRALLRSGLAKAVCGFMVGKACGSGLRNITLAAQAIQADQTQGTMTGGIENMSLTPYLFDAKTRSGYRLGDGQVYGVILCDDLICATRGYHMGITAENVIKEYRTTREVQDELALHPQCKAVTTIESGTFTVEIIPVNVVTRKKTSVFSQDEFPRADSITETLGILRPAFSKAGIVTAGNVPDISDGAITLVIMEESSVLAADLTPLARIRNYTSGGVSPALVGMGPVPATQGALQLAELQLADTDFIEVNGAFAVQFLTVRKTLGSELEKVNINGRAIALGHPIGASDARTLVTLLYAMQTCDKTLGLIALYIGGGQGAAMVIERLNQHAKIPDSESHRAFS